MAVDITVYISFVTVCVCSKTACKWPAFTLISSPACDHNRKFMDVVNLLFKHPISLVIVQTVKMNMPNLCHQTLTQDHVEEEGHCILCKFCLVTVEKADLHVSCISTPCNNFPLLCFCLESHPVQVTDSSPSPFSVNLQCVTGPLIPVI